MGKIPSFCQKRPIILPTHFDILQRKNTLILGILWFTANTLGSGVFVLNLYWRALFSCSKNILILPRFCRVKTDTFWQKLWSRFMTKTAKVRVDPYQLIFGNNLLILEKKTAFQAHFVISQPGAQPTHFEQQLTHFGNNWLISGRLQRAPPLFFPRSGREIKKGYKYP